MPIPHLLHAYYIHVYICTYIYKNVQLHVMHQLPFLFTDGFYQETAWGLEGEFIRSSYNSSTLFYSVFPHASLVY